MSQTNPPPKVQAIHTRESRKSVRNIEDGGHPFKSTQQSSYEFTETEGQSTGPGPLCMYYKF